MDYEKLDGVMIMYVALGYAVRILVNLNSKL